MSLTCREVLDYIEMVESGEVEVSQRQIKLCKYVRRVFDEEELTIDEDALNSYAKLVKYFPFDKLFPWEWFLLTLFLCTFKPDGTPRWSDLVAFVGRGAGKNGFIAFVAFCATTKFHGVQNYDVDICANSQDQAKRSFEDIWNILEANLRFKQSWHWTRSCITNKATKSNIQYRTDNPKSKDGMRSGLIIFDEVHAYQNWKNITVFTTGLGKCANPRRAFISSNGDVRDGVFDIILKRCDDILDGKIDDNGYLPFIYLLEDAKEVDDKNKWTKANPSIQYMPILRKQIEKEYTDWKFNPFENSDFLTKRMGIPQGDKENEVTAWDNLVAASRDTGDLIGKSCVCGIDFARTSDFISVCLLFHEHDEWQVIHHSWWCSNSNDKAHVKAPIKDWADKGIVTIVDDVEIHPRLITDYIYEMAYDYSIEAVAIDDYRFTLLMRELEEIGYTLQDKTVKKVRPSDHMKVQPAINSAFLSKNIAWGDDPCMRWFTNNTKLVILPNSNGNYKYDKIEPRSRKTDGFMALVAAFTISDAIVETASTEIAEPMTF